MREGCSCIKSRIKMMQVVGIDELCLSGIPLSNCQRVKELFSVLLRDEYFENLCASDIDGLCPPWRLLEVCILRRLSAITTF